MRLILSQAGGGPEIEAVQVQQSKELVFYRIQISERTGRFEQPLSTEQANPEKNGE
ncbi:MAG: hypothetical protein ACR2PL_09660 [Dehalococcoidia bacterium]